MTSRPAMPESETPETDAELAKIGNYGAYPGTDGADGVTAQEDFEARVLGLCRSLERRLSLAQTEIKGHVRNEGDLLNELALARADWACAQARIAELEKDSRIVLMARALVPFLEEGWDEQDDELDQNSANNACERLIAAVRERP